MAVSINTQRAEGSQDMKIQIKSDRFVSIFVSFLCGRFSLSKFIDQTSDNISVCGPDFSQSPITGLVLRRSLLKVRRLEKGLSPCGLRLTYGPQQNAFITTNLLHVCSWIWEVQSNTSTFCKRKGYTLFASL